MTNRQIEGKRRQAKKGDLIYISDQAPGYQRKRWGRGFIYLNSQGRKVSDSRVLRRFKSLAIPPAWRDVWIARDPNGHIQATGRDARGRKQYIYHPRWQELSALTKFDHLESFAAALPAIRRRIRRDLARSGLAREKSLAFALRLLDVTLLRIGNTEYTRQNRSYGLTTLRKHHVEVDGTVLHIHFTAKGGKPRSVDLKNRRLAKIARKLRELPGQHFVKYRQPDGTVEVIRSEDVNAYLREICDEDFTAKEFRTWGATVLAAGELYRLGPPATKKEAESSIRQILRKTGRLLGNTPAVCRKYYVHPAVLEGYRSRRLFEFPPPAASRSLLYPEERLTVKLLKGTPASRRTNQ